MKKTFLILAFLGALLACKNEPKFPKIGDVSGVEGQMPLKIFSNLPFDFTCESKIDSTVVPPVDLKKVNLNSADLKDPAFVIEITSCDEVSKEDYSKYNIPEDSDAAVKGVTVDKRDIIMVVKTEKAGIAIVTRGFEGTDGYKFEPYKKYTLNAHGYKMEAQTVITSNN